MSEDPTCWTCPQCKRRPIALGRKITIGGARVLSCEACYRTEYRSIRPKPRPPRQVGRAREAPVPWSEREQPRVSVPWWERPRAQPRIDKTRGYFKISIPSDHPLSTNSRFGARRPSRSTGAHRVVLFDRIGYGPHRCHWCSKDINWRAGLVVDHLDDTQTNNDPDNLVPSCTRCNTTRGRSVTLSPDP